MLRALRISQVSGLGEHGMSLILKIGQRFVGHPGQVAVELDL